MKNVFQVTKNNEHVKKYNDNHFNQNLNSLKEIIIKESNLELTLNNNKKNMKTIDNNPTCNKKLINNINNYHIHKYKY